MGERTELGSDGDVIVEHSAVGDDYRLLVVGEKMVAAARREPAHVIGNGRATINELIEEVNRDPRRSDGHATVLSKMWIDGTAAAVLAEQGFTVDSVPAEGVKVLIRRNANLSTGGTATDVTDRFIPTSPNTPSMRRGWSVWTLRGSTAWRATSPRR